MFWRRRNDGFEWRQYVRTTILVRRGQRRQKLEGLKDQAVDGVKEAGRRGAKAGVAGAGALKDAGFRGVQSGAKSSRVLAAGVGQALKSGGRWVMASSERAAGAVGPRIAPVMARARRGSERVLGPAVKRLANRRVRLALTGVGIIAAGAASVRASQFGFDRQVQVAAIVAAVSLLLVAIPFAAAAFARIRVRQGNRLHGDLRRASVSQVADVIVDGLRSRRVRLAGLVILAAASAFGIWHLMQPGEDVQTASIGRTTPLFKPVHSSATGDPLIGRATAMSGDTLRLQGTTLKLAGIEAPEPDQNCRRPGMRRWRCGSTARTELGQVLSRREIVCQITGASGANGQTARCMAGSDDIAAELVRKGYVFAESGIFAAYGSLEEAARAAKVGLWAGEAQRPAEFRAAKWDEAKRAAPEGCPIKGRVRSGSRFYVLPWSSTYEDTTVRASRGDRWFCSESEAVAAGWQRADRTERN